jgi:hypothetical protein
MQQGTGYLTHQFGAEDLKSNLSPSYEFMLKEGQRAARQRLNAGGSGGSDIDRGITKFAQDYASTNYQQAFNNYNAQRKDIYNTLASIAGIGQAGQTATNAAGTTYANNASNLATSAGAAQAAGTVGAANAVTGALGNIGAQNYISNLSQPAAPITQGTPSYVAPSQAMNGGYMPIIG